MIPVGCKGEFPLKILILNTLSVSTKGTIRIAIPTTTEDSTGIVIAVESATVINLITNVHSPALSLTIPNLP